MKEHACKQNNPDAAFLIDLIQDIYCYQFDQVLYRLLYPRFLLLSREVPYI